MIKTETNTAAAVAAQGAHVAPEKAPSKKGREAEEGRAQGPDSRQGCQSPGRRPEEGGQGQQEGRQIRSHEGVRHAARRNQGREDPGDDRERGWCHVGQDHEGHRLAGALCRCRHKAHSVRGFISTAAKKNGIKIESSKNESGERVYRTSK